MNASSFASNDLNVEIIFDGEQSRRQKDIRRRGKFQRASRGTTCCFFISDIYTFGTGRRVYLLASDTLDYSLNVRQIDRLLRNIIYLTKRVSTSLFLLLSLEFASNRIVTRFARIGERLPRTDGRCSRTPSTH